MTIDLTAAADFMAGHARTLDRRRFELMRGETDNASGVLAALDAYRNPDGGYGWGLEPDLRSPESQPAAAAHAFEVFENVAPVTSPHAPVLCDWLDSVTLADGGLPLAVPLTLAAGSAPWWESAAASGSSLQITSVTAGAAQRVAARDPAVAEHPWLERATRFCLDAIAAMDEPPFAYVLVFSLRFLDAVYESRPEAAALMEKLAKHVPDDGNIRVSGGTEDEMLHPLDVAPEPDRPARQLYAPELIAADLDRLAALQQDDGGWVVDYMKISPAGSLDWRGYATVRAVDILRRNTLAEDNCL
jgi:hypothetical protein